MSINQVYKNETITEVCKRILAEDGLSIWKWSINPEDRMEVICEGRRYDKNDNLIRKETILVNQYLIELYLY